MTTAPTPLRRLLSGGDRRSLAQASTALDLVRASPGLVQELAGLALDADGLVSMRAADLLEKLAHDHPDWIQPHKSVFIGPLADSDRWEIHLQIVRALPLLKWTTRETKRVVEILKRDVNHKQTFVRAWALDSLASFAVSDRTLLPEVRQSLAEFEQSDKKALVARARQIRKRLADQGIS